MGKKRKRYRKKLQKLHEEATISLIVSNYRMELHEPCSSKWYNAAGGRSVATKWLELVESMLEEEGEGCE